MVRVGTLPTRLLCLDYGADLVYTEETIDYRLLTCERQENSLLGTVDFTIPGDQFPLLRTCAKERNQVVFQMGTSEPERALAAAKFVEKDVSAIDINMGCPKSFSICSGMGASLLENPLRIKEILTALVDGVQLPITCKIRILPNETDTFELCRLIQTCGVSALAVHGRTKTERPRDTNKISTIRKISEMLDIPVIANGGSGEISCFEDIEKFKTVTGCSSVMVARAAQWDPSIFRKAGKVAQNEVIKSYLRYAVDYDSCPQNAKYVLQQILREKQQTTEEGRALLKAPTVKEMCRIWKLTEHYNNAKTHQRDRLFKAERLKHTEELRSEENHQENGKVLGEIGFVRCYFGQSSPKCVLHDYLMRENLGIATYEVMQRPVDCKFLAKVMIDDKTYESTLWERNRRYAEQSAAIVALKRMGLTSLLPSAYHDNL